MSAYKALQAKKRSGAKLTPLETWAWEAGYTGGDEEPATELAAKDARIAQLEERITILENDRKETIGRLTAANARITDLEQAMEYMS